MDEFHKHLDHCDQCKNNPFNLCAEGARLLEKSVREYSNNVFNEKILDLTRATSADGKAR